MVSRREMLSKIFGGISSGFDSLEEEFETYTPAELCEFAAEKFETMLNKHKAPETLVEEILNLFEIMMREEGRIKLEYQNN